MNPKKISKAYRMLKFIDRGSTRKIIRILEHYGPLNGDEIQAKLSYLDWMQQPVVSKILVDLHKIGVIYRERNGKFILNCLDEERINQINQITKQLNESKAKTNQSEREPVQECAEVHDKTGGQIPGYVGR